MKDAHQILPQAHIEQGDWRGAVKVGRFVGHQDTMSPGDVFLRLNILPARRTASSFCGSPSRLSRSRSNPHVAFSATVNQGPSGDAVWMAQGDALGGHALPRNPWPSRRVELATGTRLGHLSAEFFEKFHVQAFATGVREIPFTAKLKKMSEARLQRSSDS